MRCGAVRCDAVRCGAVRCGAMRCDAVRSGAMQCDAVRCDAVRCGAVRCGVRCGVKQARHIIQYAQVVINDAAMKTTFSILHDTTTTTTTATATTADIYLARIEQNRPMTFRCGRCHIVRLSTRPRSHLSIRQDPHPRTCSSHPEHVLCCAQLPPPCLIRHLHALYTHAHHIPGMGRGKACEPAVTTHTSTGKLYAMHTKSRSSSY
jgi:hypothetical protein